MSICSSSEKVCERMRPFFLSLARQCKYVSRKTIEDDEAVRERWPAAEKKHRRNEVNKVGDAWLRSLCVGLQLLKALGRGMRRLACKERARYAVSTRAEKVPFTFTA